jgi:hypothetical protein
LDWPVVGLPNPWFGIQGMVTRRNPNGSYPGALWPEQALDLASVLRLYTTSTVSNPASLIAAIMAGWATLSCPMVTILVGMSTVTVVTPAISLTSLVMARTQ